MFCFSAIEAVLPLPIVLLLFFALVSLIFNIYLRLIKIGRFHLNESYLFDIVHFIIYSSFSLFRKFGWFNIYSISAFSCVDVLVVVVDDNDVTVVVDPSHPYRLLYNKFSARLWTTPSGFTCAQIKCNQCTACYSSLFCYISYIRENDAHFIQNGSLRFSHMSFFFW